jgi:hypothetical protein
LVYLVTGTTDKDVGSPEGKPTRAELAQSTPGGLEAVRGTELGKPL